MTCKGESGDGLAVGKGGRAPGGRRWGVILDVDGVDEFRVELVVGRGGRALSDCRRGAISDGRSVINA